MSTKSGGSFATILLALPLTAIALMGVFGVPEFASVIASPERDDLRRRPYEGSSDGRYYDSDRDTPRHDGYGQRRDPFAEDAPAFGDSNPASYRQVDERDRRYGEGRSAESPSGPRYEYASDVRNDDRSYAGRSSESPRGNPFAEAPPAEVRLASADRQATTWNDRPAAATRDSTGLDWRGAARKLADMGIEHYHLERGATPESFLFVCLVTPGDGSNVTHRFEAEHSDPLAAVGRVLQQVEGWLQQRYAQRSFPRQ